jgi:RNA polymerase sigma-70 factor (ECF subfamily)
MPEDVSRASFDDFDAGEQTGRANRSDSRLVQVAVSCAKEGDRSALHFLFVRYAPDLNRYVNSFVHDRHEAEDIVQDIFAKLGTGIGKYEQRDLPFRAWIMRVARNAALDHVRARHAIPVEEVRVAEDDTSGHSSQVNLERSQDLRQALERLPDDQREVLVLRHVLGLSPVEIADALGKSESSVNGLHHRGSHRLRSSLRDMGAVPTLAP